MTKGIDNETLCKIKHKAVTVLRFIVGREYGFAGEGNVQWYYSIALAINLMLIWWLAPQIGLVFTILTAIHYATVFVYGHFGLSEEGGLKTAYFYIGIHLTILTVAFITSWNWSLISIVITVISTCFAPNAFGENLFFSNKMPFYDGKHFQLVFHTVIFMTFIVIDFLLPIMLWIKFFIIIGAWLLHPLIDWTEAKYGNAARITSDIIENLIYHKWKSE